MSLWVSKLFFCTPNKNIMILALVNFFSRFFCMVNECRYSLGFWMLHLDKM